MAKLNVAQKQQVIIDVLGELGPLDPPTLSQRTGIESAELKTLIFGLKEGGTVVIAGKTAKLSPSAQDEWEEENKPKPAKKEKPTPKSKEKEEVPEWDEETQEFIDGYYEIAGQDNPSKADKKWMEETREYLESLGWTPEEEVPDEEEEEGDDWEEEEESDEEEEVPEYTQEEIDDMMTNYNRLYNKRVKNKSEQAKLAELEEVLTELGAFDAEDTEDTEDEEEVPEEVVTVPASKEPDVLDLVDALLETLNSFRNTRMKTLKKK